MLNISHNCIDRHTAKNPNKTAIIWQGDEKENTKNISYAQLLVMSKLANGLKSIGVKKGDRVCIYMPMIPRECLFNVGLYANRCNTFCSIWWVFQKQLVQEF